MTRPVVAFFGYARAADEGTHGAIGELHRALQERVRLRIGRGHFTLWRDTAELQTGEEWERGVMQALREAAFYVPVLTPDFFESDWCRREAETFLALKDRGDARRHVLPLYVIKDVRLEQERMRKRDPLRTRLNEFHRKDVREHLDDGWLTSAAKRAIAEVAETIAERVVELAHQEELLAEASEKLAAKDLAGARDLLLEGGFQSQAELCQRLGDAIEGQNWTEAHSAIAEGREGLLGSRWDVWQGVVAELGAVHRAAEEAAAERAAAEKAAAEKAAAERAAAEKAATERAAAEKTAAQKAAAEKAAAETVAAEKTAAEKAASRNPLLPGTVYRLGKWAFRIDPNRHQVLLWNAQERIGARVFIGSNGWWMLQEGGGLGIVYPDKRTAAYPVLVDIWSAWQQDPRLDAPIDGSATLRNPMLSTLETRIDVHAASIAVHLGDYVVATAEKGFVFGRRGERPRLFP